MTTRNQRWWLCLVGLVALGGCKSGSAPAPSRLNLLLVTIDTLRADRLGCYGYSQIETPNLDRIARQGALFENAVASAPLTAPSHASMMTGVYPTVHKVRNTGGFVLSPSEAKLAKILQDQGWDTAAFVGSSVLKGRFGFNQGFTVYDDEMPTSKSGSAVAEPERRAARGCGSRGQVARRAIGKALLSVGTRVRSAHSLRPSRSVPGEVQRPAIRRRDRLYGPATGTALRHGRQKIPAGEHADRGVVGSRGELLGTRRVHARSLSLRHYAADSVPDGRSGNPRGSAGEAAGADDRPASDNPGVDGGQGASGNSGNQSGAGLSGQRSSDGVCLCRDAVPQVQHGLGRTTGDEDDPVEVYPRAKTRTLRSGAGPGGNDQRDRESRGGSAGTGGPAQSDQRRRGEGRSGADGLAHDAATQVSRRIWAALLRKGPNSPAKGPIPRTASTSCVCCTSRCTPALPCPSVLPC